MNAPITVTPIIPLGRDTVIEGDPYTIPGRGNFYPRLPQPVMPQPVMPQPVAARPTASTPNQENLLGLLTANRQDPLAAGLMGMGRALLNYGAPSLTPKGGFMGAIGAGGQGFMDDYQKTQSANLANRLAAYQLMASMKEKPVAVGNRYIYEDGKFISPTGTGASAQPPMGVNYTPLELEQYRALADDPEEQVKFIERINKVRDDAHRNFRTEIRPFAKQLQEIDRKTSIVFAAVEKRNGTADIAAINAYQRLIDDGVVRSDDVRLQGSAKSLRDSVVAQIENIKKGDLLPQSVRDNMADMTRVLLGETLPGIEAGITGVQEIVGMDERLDFKQVFAPSFRTFLERARRNTLPKVASTGGQVTSMPTSLGG